MTYCQECGSEVAEIDVFCPYCGISITPAADVESSDPSFDSTIVMQPGAGAETAKPVSEEAAKTVAAEKLSDTEEVPAAELDAPTPVALKELESTAGDLFKGLESPKYDTETTAEPDREPEVVTDPDKTDADISVPSGFEGLPVASADNLVSDPPAPVELSAPAEIEGIEVETPVLEEPEAEDQAEVQLDAPGEIGDPEADRDTLEQPEFGDIDELKAEPAAEMVPPPESPDIEPEPPAVDNEPERDRPINFDRVDLFHGVPSDSPPESEPVTAAEVDDVNDAPSISKPLNEPIPADSFSEPSVFDSVRIMEKPKSEEIPFNAGVLQDASDKGASESPTLLGGNVGAESQPTATAGNIGLVDTDGRKTTKLKPLEEGALLNGRYEIVRKIGGGGMGAVYLASDNNLGGVLRAVKEMVQSHIEEVQQDKAISDFKRESMILSTLDHPSIPTIYDYFFDDKESRFYLVMKYISGGDLASRLRAAPEGKLDEKTVTEWAIQIADVLDYLHNQPTTIVYRDLKPSNIMIDGNSGRVMLIDFGIARSIHQKEEKGVTAVGTMGYAPPELFSGNVEPRSDIYSLGSTMFHLLTGADPQSNPLLIFDFQKNPRPRQINPQLSDQIERLLMRTVEYSAQSRFSTAAELRQTLDEHLENLKRGSVTYGIKEIPASVSLANQSVFCGFCGQKIVATDLFCAFCGAKQPIAQHGVHSEIYSPAQMTAKLMVVGTSDLESPAFHLDKSENLIGRRDPMSNIFPEVDLSKYDPQTKISRRHAKIWREGSSYLVEDLGSSNGTILFPTVSGTFRLTPHQPRALASGDKIKLGDTTLHFVIG